MLKKPLVIESLGKALRTTLGPLERNGAQPRLQLDARTHTLRSIAGEAHLTTIESELLEHLMTHRGEILHPSRLLMDVWHYRDAAVANTLVRAHISNLRKKLRKASGTDRLIDTVRGQGYRFIA